jgi:type I restriction enzyme M protein
VVGISGAKSTTQTVYDPTCGSGSLLLKAHHAAPVNVSIYGQEMDVATTALCKMNMILHGCPTAEIAPGGSSTLAAPHFKEKSGKLKTFDFIVANPPFSTKSWTNGFTPEADEFERFGFGMPPEKNGDYAFVLHMLASLKSTGKACIVLPHGVLFRGNAEADIRRNIVKAGFVKGIIGLPANLFYGVGIPALLLVLDKEGAPARKGIFMVDASKGFIKDGNKNRLREQDIHRIVDTFAKMKDLPRFARMVSLAEIADPKNDYNLNLPRYIDSSEPEDLQDIDAHLRGGIPSRDVDSLDAYWKVFPGVRAALFSDAGRAGYSQLRQPVAEVKPAILGHSEFTAFNGTVMRLFEQWSKSAVPQMKAFGKGGKPKVLVDKISEELLSTFGSAPLLDAYDIYQHLMDLWASSMQDDCYLIAAEGWRAAAQPQPVVEEKGSKQKAKPDLVVGKKKFTTELVPPRLIVARWFASEQAAVEKLEAEVAALDQQVEEMTEEHGGDDGLLADAANDKGKVTKASAAARLKALGRDAAAADEIRVLKELVAIMEKSAAASGKLSDAQDALAEEVAAKYPKLTEDEVKTLVVDDKWHAALAAAVKGEIDRVSQTLGGRVRELAARYESPLPTLVDEVATLSTRVEGHLKKMRASWR